MQGFGDLFVGTILIMAEFNHGAITRREAGQFGAEAMLEVALGSDRLRAGSRIARGWQFLVESLTLSLLGGLLGAALGAGLALLVGLKVPVSIQPWTLLLSLGFAVSVGLFFGVYPAKKAADLDPIEALRYD